MMRTTKLILGWTLVFSLLCATASFAKDQSVYFLKGDQFGAVSRSIPEGPDSLKAVFSALADGPTADELAAGWRSVLPEGTKLLSVKQDGSDLTVEFGGVPAPENSIARDLISGQIARTAANAADVFALKIRWNGEGFRSVLSPLLTKLPLDPVQVPWKAHSLGHLEKVGKDGSISYTVLGSLLGKRIAISPGHGWTHYTKGWELQRPYESGIVEDFENAEIIMYLNKYLNEAGARVIPLREMDKNAGNGESGHPKWQEAARYYAKSQGAPEWVYDLFKNDEEGSDIDCRGIYAAWRGADIMVSLHNNGSKATGTVTLYENNNGFQNESKQLAEDIHESVVDMIKKQIYPNWYSFGARGFNGSYGENNWCQQPSCLIEVAFMDREEPDNRLLHDEKFKETVAKAIYEGICKYFNVDPTYKMYDWQTK